MSRLSPTALLGLFLRTALRRFANRYLLAVRRMNEAGAARKSRSTGDRDATAHRQQMRLREWLSSGVLTMLVLSGIAIGIVMSFLNASTRARTEVELHSAVIPLQDYVKLERHDKMYGVDKTRDPKTFPALELARDGGDDARNLLVAHYDAHGLAGFRPAERAAPWRSEAAWMAPETRALWFRVAGLLAGGAALYVLASGLGLLNKNLNSAEPQLLWLFDFPVPRTWLFAAKVVETAFDNIGSLLTAILPGALIWQAGAGWTTVVVGGLGFGLLMSINVAAMRVLTEVYLLKNFKRRARGVIAGFLTIVSMLLMMVIFYGGQSPQLARCLLWLSAMLPSAFWWNPLMLGLGSDPGALTHPLGLWGLALVITVIFTVACVLAAAGLTRGGFEPTGESVARGLEPMVASPEGKRWLTPLIRRELLRLRRQPSVLVQMIGAPALMFLMQYLVSGGSMVRHMAGSADALATSIYGISVYLVLTSGMAALTQEIKCVVFMLALPRSLADAFRAAARLTGSVAIGMALVLGGVAVVAWPEYAPRWLPRLPFMLIFLWWLAELLRGIQLLGLSILSDTRVTLTTRSTYLTLILAGSAGHAVFQGNLWTLTVMAALIGLLNLSVWQKVRAELPYLTEPVLAPPPRLHLMHGMQAIFFFFVGQNMVAAISLAAGLPIGQAVVLGYGVSGLVAGSLTVWLLARDKVKWRPQAKGPVGAALAGAGLGWAATVLMGWAWLTFLRKHGDLPAGLDLGRVWLVALAVLAAPVVEEILFRGLVYQGLRQTLTPLRAALLSSVLFTIVHPELSAPGVFLLAMVNAVLLERTGRLWPGILVHAGYNAVILTLQ